MNRVDGEELKYLGSVFPSNGGGASILTFPTELGQGGRNGGMSLGFFVIDERPSSSKVNSIGQIFGTSWGNPRLRWFGHVMCRGEEDQVGAIQRFRVEGRRGRGRHDLT